MVVAEWWWLVVVERWWPLSLSNVVGLVAKREEVVVLGWFGCGLVVVGGMLEVVVAVRAVVVVRRWQRAADVAVVRVVERWQGVLAWRWGGRCWASDMAMVRAVVVVRLCSARSEG